ncbi:MAG: helix-turn-helix domain-containing protein [Spirochaetaceae bacterium]|nr:helix-turn-helix domain-containing protein [Spirochaetaceae bacterium]
MFRLIVAEDEEPFRRELEAATPWEDWGFVLVGSARDGEEAYSLAMELRPDMLATDLRMPRLDGLELVERLALSLGADEMPLILVLTAHAEFDFARRALRLGAFDYLCKPVDDAELADAMRRASEALSERARERALASAGPSTPALAFFAEYAPSGSRSQADVYVEKAVNAIRERYVRELSADETARALGITGGHLARIFKAKTGLTFAEYLVRYRMKRAAELLAEGELRIGEVADMVGYADQRHFSSLFRRLVGVTPTEFREGKFGGKQAQGADER